MNSSNFKPRWFRCLMGEHARTVLQQDASPDTFTLLLAASGGPRWLGLVGIDRSLRGFLSQRSSPIATLGASSGAWRMAALAADQSGETYEHLIDEYIEQRYSGKPTAEEISAVCRAYLARLFGPERIESALSHPTFQLNFTTALMSRESPTVYNTVATLAWATLLNILDRRLIGHGFKRAVFSRLPHPEHSPLANPWDSIPSVTVPLTRQNFLPGIMATGSIPMVLAGESAIDGSPPGHHYDGGLLDYHFEVEASGPILYPHFSADPIPGWMDRFFPYRRISREARSHLCIILPTDQMLTRYPLRDYPSRHDFKRYPNEERISYWRDTVKENQLLERELMVCLEAGDLVRVSETF